MDIYREERPWGSFETLVKNTPATVKILRINSGQEFSLQKHAERSEFWKVIEGSGVIRVGDVEREAWVGDEIEVRMGELHRITGGSDGIAVLEIATGKFDENDITRVEDDYGRV